MNLVWPIRRSFTGYVRSQGGTVTLGGGVTESDAGYVFKPMDAQPVDATAGDEIILAFSGFVSFSAHGGLLEVMIGNPVLAFSKEGGSMSVVTDEEGSRTTLARIVDVDLEELAAAKLQLTVAGTRLLGDVYAPGAELDPIELA